jgi:hypothetical protein
MCVVPNIAIFCIIIIIIIIIILIIIIIIITLNNIDKLVCVMDVDCSLRRINLIFMLFRSPSSFKVLSLLKN